MKAITFLLAVTGIIITSQGCVSTLPRQGPPHPGTFVMDAQMTTSGFSRKSLVHIPHGYTSEHAYPLLVMLHGAFSNASEVEQITGFSDLAGHSQTKNRGSPNSSDIFTTGQTKQSAFRTLCHQLAGGKNCRYFAVGAVDLLLPKNARIYRLLFDNQIWMNQARGRTKRCS